MISLLDFIFLNMAFAIIVVGFLINTLEEYLPVFVVKSFRYGKFAYEGQEDNQKTLPEFPKSHFRHFYVTGTFCVLLSFLYAINVYLYGVQVPGWLLTFLDVCCGSERVTRNSPMATTLALFLLSVQCLRRLYETFFIQVFSDSAKINLSHYAVGHFHYVGCVLAILGKASGFTRTQEEPPSGFLDIHTSIVALPAIVLFAFAWRNQFESNKILANLRKNSSKKTVSQKYFLPTAGWFRYISSPHLLFEITIYISLLLLLVQNFSWLCVVAWVVSNQVETAIMSHQWYKKQFPKFPKDRKVLIPYIF